MTNTTPVEVGLRARKREATRAGLERAALSLALEHGYDAVTVDMICDAGMVSPRTFFNYFGTREGVFLGAGPPLPDEDAIRAFVHDGGIDLLGELVGMITAAIADPERDTELLRSRRALIVRTPELLNRETARIAELEDRLMRIVLDRFHARGRTEALTPDLEDEARMVVGLAAGVMRYTPCRNGSAAAFPAPRANSCSIRSGSSAGSPRSRPHGTVHQRSAHCPASNGRLYLNTTAENRPGHGLRGKN
jgi:AcrR family transcriptional regulator